ncbi:MAG: ATP-binding protein [Synergistaceae bacterium]|nr:ATP-binding protein [Synergistaceae bacterium]
MRRELIAFRSLQNDEVFSFISGLISGSEHISRGDASDAASEYCDCIAEMAASAENNGISGNIWNSWVAMLLASCETPFALAQERRAPLKGTLSRIVLEDLDTIFSYLDFDLNKIDEELGVSAFGRFGDYEPLSLDVPLCGMMAEKNIQCLADSIAKASSGEELRDALMGFYSHKGVGLFALNKAFRWDAREREITPVTHTDDITLSSLVGYEEQKKMLVDNTLAFLEGRPANNVLLYGESGTGKSSSIKALLNEYESKGLRMIEVYKHQIEDLDTIIDTIKNRSYKFIIFMDDLSFEHFEVEYKFLKAFIEGGLEKRPDNVLIYATSNRRHLMKETWADRDDKYEDMHESETEQERMSLVDRFGLMISYFSPAQEEYFEIVYALAKEYGLSVSDEELERGAIQWELKHGGFSGRSARQFVEFLAGKNK